MKRIVKASTDTDEQTIVDIAKEGYNWRDPAYVKGYKGTWYQPHKVNQWPDGTVSALWVSEYKQNNEGDLELVEPHFRKDMKRFLKFDVITPVIVKRMSQGLFLKNSSHRTPEEKDAYWAKKIAEYKEQNANSSTRSNMKKVVRGSRGTAQDLINALNNRIDDIQDGTVASTEVTAMKSAYNRDSIRSQVEDYLGEYVKDFDVDGIVDEISDFETEDGSYVSNIDQIDSDEFQDVVRSYERNVAACSVKGATDFNENGIADELIDYLGDDIVSNDVESLFDELKKTYPTLQSIKDLPQGELDRLVRKYNESEPEADDVEYQYSIEDTHGTPQAGLEVLDFETWDELQEYLDENPDVQKRVEEGYATIKEL